MKILSWNVNGIRAVAQKGFWQWIDDEKADIICLQEPKANCHQLEADLQILPNYHASWHADSKPGYAGTVTYSLAKPLHAKNIFLDIPYFHTDGRVVETKFADFTLLNLYFPNGGTRADGQEMLTYKLKFYQYFLAYINQLRSKGEKIIACGDFNVCHTEHDIARPKENQNSIGFLPIERACLSEIINNDYVDVWRYFNPNIKNQYTWWSYRAGARQNNIGWRIDYFFISSDLLPMVKKVYHQNEVLGSDHCPIGLELSL